MKETKDTFQNNETIKRTKQMKVGYLFFLPLIFLGGYWWWKKREKSN